MRGFRILHFLRNRQNARNMLRPMLGTMRSRSFLKAAGWGCVHMFNIGCAFHLFVDYIGWLRLCNGPSMLPTLAVSGDLLLEDRLSFRLNPHSLKRGELITFNSPVGVNRVACKRVLGLPGDVVCVDPTGTYSPSTEHIVVPKNHIWVVGDNALWSRDSRLHGPVPLSLVRGRVRARLLPWRNRTIFRSNITSLD